MVAHHGQAVLSTGTVSNNEAEVLLLDGSATFAWHVQETGPVEQCVFDRTFE